MQFDTLVESILQEQYKSVIKESISSITESVNYKLEVRPSNIRKLCSDESMISAIDKYQGIVNENVYQTCLRRHGLEK